MKFLKNNLKLIIGILIGTILAGGIVYAATSASQVTYTTDKNAEIETVAEALNDLYSIKTKIEETDATPSDILSNKKAYTKNGLITGTMENSSAELINHTMFSKTATLIESGTYYIVAISYSNTGSNTAKNYTTLKSVTNGSFTVKSQKSGDGYYGQVYEVISNGNSTVTFASETNFAIFK